jgi:serine/threonine protein kinase
MTPVAQRYKILNLLGSGNMGNLYRALDRLTGQMVALKQLARSEQITPGSSTGERDLRLTLAREFEILASLRHPYIIAVLDYGFGEDRQPFFTMELLENAQTILAAAAAYPLKTKVELLLNLFQALEYLHRRDILHHDLKPANVLVVHGQVKILDFGLSVLHGAASGTSGSLAYMAPELLQQGGRSSIVTDLYAAGMIAYEMFAGHYPFDLNDPNRLISAILNTLPDFSTLPSELSPIIARLLDKKPTARYAHAREVIEALSYVIQKPFLQESTAIQESYLQAARFVGRETELAQLIEPLGKLSTGHGSAWLISGESGVGKSRLVDEFRIHALVQGVQVLRGHAVSMGSQPYQMWNQILRWLVISTPLDDQEASVLKMLLPDIDHLLERPIEEALIVDPQTSQSRLLLVIEDLFRRQTQPLVILLEDLHWAGSESLMLLQRLETFTRQYPILIVGTYREDEKPSLAQDFRQMGHIRLNRFSKEGVIALSEAILGEVGRSEKLIHLLQKE